MGIEEGEEVQAKGIHNILIFNKIITENIPNLEKVLLVHVQEASKTPNRLAKIQSLHNVYSLKQQAYRTEKEN
jgi:hypothetical protein